MIVALAGRKRSGKDTLGRALVGQLGFTRVGLADALKDLANELLQVQGADWELLKTSPTIYNVVRNEAMTGRDILQRLGVGVRKVLGPDAWIKAALARCGVEEIDMPGHHGYRQAGNFVVTDVRFPNELHAFQQAGGVSIRLNREDSWRTFHEYESPFNVDVCTYTLLPGGGIACGLPKASHPTVFPEDRHESETSLPDASNDSVVYDNVFTGTLEMNTGRAFAYVKGLL